MAETKSFLLGSRREFITRTGLGAMGLALGLGGNRSLAQQSRRPNVLFIMIDDLNDWTGCLGGHPGASTPNLDRLAASGVLFTNAHCAAPLCNPSRAALMTGIRPSTSGIYDNPQKMLDSPVLNAESTMTAAFRRIGYTTLGSGKIYHGACPDPAAWDDYWPSRTQIRPEDPLPEGRPVNGISGTAQFDWGPLDVPESAMGDSQVADWVSAKLSKPMLEPFFLACGFFKPHLPWYAPREYFDRHPLDSIVLPEVKPDDLEDVSELARKIAQPSGDHASVTGHGQWRNAVRAYLACTSFMDNCLGRVTRALDSGPHRDNTIVVLASDHGWHLGEKLHWRKFSLWEESTRNVLVFRVPGLTAPGGVCDATVNLLDIYPTLARVCGLEQPKALEGDSLIPLLTDPQAHWDRPALTTYGRNNHSVRSREWRYTRYSDGTEELYDHRSDSHEWYNLAADPRYDQVKKELARWMPETNTAYVLSGQSGERTLNERIEATRP